MRVWCPRRFSEELVGSQCRAFARAGSHDRAHTGSGSHAGHSVELPMRELFSDVGLGTTCRSHGYKYSPITGSSSPPLPVLTVFGSAGADLRFLPE